MVIEKKGCRENNKSGMLDMTVCDAICVMELTIMGWVPILGSAARILDWRILLTQFQDYFILSLHQSRRQITVTLMKLS